MKIALSQVIRTLLVKDPKNLTETDQRVAQAFLALFPGHEKNIQSYREKPGCDCRFDLQRAMKDNPEATQQFLVEVGKANIVVDFDKYEEEHPARFIRGLVKEIPDTAEAYSALMQECTDNNLRFVGLALRPIPGDLLRVYFY